MAKTVREFSPSGPCLNLGEFVKRTPKRLFFVDRYTGQQASRGGWKIEESKDHRGYIHTDPCRSCRDHSQTQYPNGYMD